jgi:hypothetical protein
VIQVGGKYCAVLLLSLGYTLELDSVLKMCVNETYSKAFIGTYLSDIFYVPSDLKQGDTLLPLLFNFAL